MQLENQSPLCFGSSPSQAHVRFGFCSICNLGVGYMGHDLLQQYNPALELLDRGLRLRCTSAIRSIPGGNVMPQGSQRHPHGRLKSGYLLGLGSHGIQQLRIACEL